MDGKRRVPLRVIEYKNLNHRIRRGHGMGSKLNILKTVPANIRNFFFNLFPRFT
jgi:hypothetical protein